MEMCFLTSEVWKSKIRGQHGQVLLQVLFLVYRLQKTVFLLYPHMAEREIISVSSCKGTDSSQRGRGLMALSPPKAPPLNTIV